jgi:hypothetical protein
MAETAQAASHQPRIGRHARADGGIESFPRDVDQPVAGIDLQTDAGRGAPAMDRAALCC